MSINPFTHLRNSKICDFISEMIKVSYESRGIGSDVVDNILNALISNASNEKFSIISVRQKFVDNRLYDMYNKYKLIERPKFILEQFKPYMTLSDKSLLFVDVGCGENSFCEFLASKLNGSIKTIGTDVIEYTNKQNKISEFRKQSSPNNIPIKSGEANYVLLANMLHHIADVYLANFLEEIYRITADNGLVFVLEDAWAEKKDHSDDCSISKHFFQMDDNEKYEAMRIIDLIGTSLLTSDGDLMPRPFTFKTLNQWIDVLSRADFRLVDAFYIRPPRI